STTRQSHSISRAISFVNNWSHSFQPRRPATRDAISAPPLPYSRSIVITRIIDISRRTSVVAPGHHSSRYELSPSRPSLLFHCDTASSRFVLLQGERKHKHDRRHRRQNPESVDVG